MTLGANTTDEAFKKPTQVVNPVHETVDYGKATDDALKNPPNNLGLDNPHEQATQNSLIGAQGTEPVSDGTQSAEEKKRVEEMAARLNK